MLGGVDPDLDKARAIGASLFAGEAEGRLDEVLRDAAAGRLAPLYNFMADLPSISDTPIPLLAADRAQRTAGGTTSFDAGRAGLRRSPQVNARRRATRSGSQQLRSQPCLHDPPTHVCRGVPPGLSAGVAALLHD